MTEPVLLAILKGFAKTYAELVSSPELNETFRDHLAKFTGEGLDSELQLSIAIAALLKQLGFFDNPLIREQLYSVERALQAALNVPRTSSPIMQPFPLEGEATSHPFPALTQSPIAEVEAQANPPVEGYDPEKPTYCSTRPDKTWCLIPVSCLLKDIERSKNPKPTYSSVVKRNPNDPRMQ